MRIVSWNLWWRYGPWKRRQDAIAATLAETGPDVCGLQEVWEAPGENLAAELAGRLGMHWCWAAASSGRDERGEELSIGNAILSRWPIASHTQAGLPAGQVEDERRVAVHARIETPGGALPVFTTHLTYGPGLSRVRTAQASALARFVTQHAADCAYPPVVTGDLNAEPGPNELRLLGGLLTSPAVPGLVLIDAWRYAEPADPGFTWDHRNGYQAASVILRFADRLHPGRAAPAPPRQSTDSWRALPRSTASGHRIISPSWPTWSNKSQVLHHRDAVARLTICLLETPPRLGQDPCDARSHPPF